MTASTLAEAVAAHARRYAGACHMQWGVVNAVNAGPPKTVDLFIDAATVVTPGILYSATYAAPTVGDTVFLLTQPRDHGVDYVVLGKTA